MLKLIPEPKITISLLVPLTIWMLVRNGTGDNKVKNVPTAIEIYAEGSN